jgi:hypothetical protein
MTTRNAKFALMFVVALIAAKSVSAQVFIQPFPGVPGRIHVQPIVNRGVFHDRAAGLAGEVLRTGGIRVVGVDAFGAADRAGLSVGDVIASINGRSLYSQSDYVRALALAGGEARMLVIDGFSGRRQFVHAYLPVDPRLVGATTIVTGSNSTLVHGVPVAVLPDLNGWWKSDAGDLRIWQTGTDITGRLHLTDGRRADVTGKVVGDEVRFDWFISPERQGDGALQVSTSGGALFGKFTSHAGSSRSVVFKKS